MGSSGDGAQIRNSLPSLKACQGALNQSITPTDTLTQLTNPSGIFRGIQELLSDKLSNQNYFFFLNLAYLLSYFSE